MSNNLKIGLILGGVILVGFLVYLFSNKTPSQYKNPEALQNVDQSIFNR